VDHDVKTIAFALPRMMKADISAYIGGAVRELR
jgi:hypothetical protein